MSMFSKKKDKEQDILSRFGRGDARAMDVLYAEYAGYLTAVCARYVAQEEDLHDVLQEALIKIFSCIASFTYQGPGSLKAWMTRIVVNEALMFLRGRRPGLFVDTEPDDLHLVDESTEDPPDAALSADRLTQLIQQLPDGYRAVFNLYAIEGKSHKEIATMLGIRPDTSASQYHRARAMLARLINEERRKEATA